MTDLAAYLLGAAWLTAGAATWLWLVGRTLRGLDPADWWALPVSLALWPAAMLYAKAWLRGYDAAHQRRDGKT